VADRPTEGSDADARSAGRSVGATTARVDAWLWSIRLYRTRSDATAACRGGHVRVNDRPAKAAVKVAPGDRVVARAHGIDRVVEVVRPIEKRVGASVAADCFVDHTPAPVIEDETPVVQRDRGSGRPTKRDRRLTDRLRGTDRRA
jgi:ribosome-associated heat shock protein Hsp15